MIKRFDLSDRDLKFYPQYYKDSSFIEKSDGRFIKWNDLPDHIKDELMLPNDAVTVIVDGKKCEASPELVSVIEGIHKNLER